MQTENLAIAMGTAARLLAGHGIPLDEIERLMRRQVLRQVIENKHGNLCHAALALGLHRNTMTRHVNELQLGAEVAEIRRSQNLAAGQNINQKIGGAKPVRAKARAA